MVQQRNDEGQTKATPGVMEKNQIQCYGQIYTLGKFTPSLQRNKAKANSLRNPSWAFCSP